MLGVGSVLSGWAAGLGAGTVGLLDLPVALAPVGDDPTLLHGARRDAYMDLWGAFDALGSQGQAGHPFGASCGPQGAIAKVLPALSPLVHQGAVVPGAFLLGVEPIPVDPAHGHQAVDMGVPVLGVQVPVHHHPGVHHRLELLADVVRPLLLGDPQGDGELDLTGKLGITAALGGFDPVPQGAAIQDPGRGIGGGHDLGQDHLGLPVGEGHRQALVAQGCTGPVGGSSHDGAPGRERLAGSADDLGRPMEHGAPGGRGCGGGTPLRGVGGRSLLTAHIPKGCISAPSLTGWF